MIIIHIIGIVKEPTKDLICGSSACALPHTATTSLQMLLKTMSLLHAGTAVVALGFQRGACIPGCYRPVVRSPFAQQFTRQAFMTAAAPPESSNEESNAQPTGYDHAALEFKWQQYWREQRTFATRRREGKEKKYVLDMFPYPSGAGLHVGHPEGYTASDIMARYWRMCDFDVLHPMGWDAFGLPAEQHAINTGTHPEETTKLNIANFKRQLQSLGFSYDWDRELATTDEGYVKWTQWIFVQLFRKGLAFQKEVLVNWCPELGTVLANEEIVDGVSERGGFPVQRMPLRQWILQITAYADKLAAELEEEQVEWPEGTVTMQKSWIGRSEGANIDFILEGGSSEDTVTVFTTRPDTLMGVSYVVIAPEHPLAAKLAAIEGDHQAALVDYIDAASRRSDLERTAAKSKTGVFTGAMVRHPLSDEKVPLWTSDYVLSTYGTGAVMAVPAHDERDFEFALKFKLPIIQVVAPEGGQSSNELEEAFTGPGVCVNSGEGLDGLSTEECKAAVIRQLQEKKRGESKVSYKLRDWVFSRQRYWGEPIPVYFPVTMEDPTGDPRVGDAHTIDYSSPQVVDESELPVRLPELEDFKPGSDPQGCLARVLDWRFFERDGHWFARETNTMPQWAGSCWYYLRFADPHNQEAFISPKAERDWLPVDLYVGGAEHAVLHLLYARFWHKVLYDLGLVTTKEPFKKLVHQGMILGADGEKMSKSRGNVVNPDDIVRSYGADAMRLYEMFMGPLEAVKPWQTEQIAGVVRFQKRVYNLAGRVNKAASMSDETERLMHQTIRKVSNDMDTMSFNTAISQLMVFSTHLASLDDLPEEPVSNLALLLSPMAPHLGEEVWQTLGNDGSLAYVPWPKYDEAKCVESTVTMGVQVNGKVRGEIQVSREADEATVKELALSNVKVAKFTDGKEIKKFIYVPGKIVNLVVGK
ncbi:hypothetical protein AB1Y20_018897 [Prymnesium parvum]|uniref:leucine--tRNA ligase n=1 Tax=Prymnesium parvum TaxID=97485 RepID=A0AB34JT32_PRYPA